MLPKLELTLVSESSENEFVRIEEILEFENNYKMNCGVICMRKGGFEYLQTILKMSELMFKLTEEGERT